MLNHPASPPVACCKQEHNAQKKSSHRGSYHHSLSRNFIFTDLKIWYTIENMKFRGRQILAPCSEVHHAIGAGASQLGPQVYPTKIRRIRIYIKLNSFG